MKILDVGAGFHKYTGSISIDANALSKPDIVHDLNAYPWPIKDNEFDMVHSSHCIEHLSDPKKAVEEMWRITRPGGIVNIKVPHFSSRVAWTDIEHTRAFSTNMFRRFTEEFSSMSASPVRYSVEKVKLHWQQRIDAQYLPSSVRLIVPFIRLIDGIISGFANLNIVFAERIWCYYVGGFGEMEFVLRTVKK